MCAYEDPQNIESIQIKISNSYIMDEYGYGEVRLAKLSEDGSCLAETDVLTDREWMVWS